MKLLKTHMVLCVLLWTMHASGFKSSIGTHFRRTQNNAGKEHEELQLNTFTANSGNSAVPQKDQAIDSSVSNVRRVLKGQRLITQTNSNTQPVRKPNIPHTNPSLQQKGPQSSPLRIPSGTNSILASFAGKSRLLVISAPYESDGYYKLMMSLLKSDVYCEMADRHMQQIILFHGKEEMGGKVRRVSNQGSIIEEPLDPALVPKLMNFLKLEDGKFGMVLLKKTLQVEETYPYPVRLEAMYEVIDQTPLRRHEKVRQKGFVERCKARGMEGKLVQSNETVMTGSKLSLQINTQNTVRLEGEKSTPCSTQSSPMQPTTTTTTKETKKPTTTSAFTKPATTKAAATTQQATTITTASTTLPSTLSLTIANPTTLSSKMAHRRLNTTHRHRSPLTHSKPTHRPVIRKQPKEPKDHQNLTTTIPFFTSDFITQHRGKDKEQTLKILHGVHNQKSIKEKTSKGKNKKVQINTKTEDNKAAQPTASQPVKSKLTKGKTTLEKAERNKKAERPDKPVKMNNVGKKVPTASKSAEANRNAAKKASSRKETDVLGKPTEKPADSKKSLETFLNYFEKKRRLLVITAPTENDKMYSQQKDEYVEHVCDMALRKISIITIFGPLENGSMKIDHYQMEQDKPVRGLPNSELINQELITAFRKDLGIVSNEFYMVLTDFDTKVKQQYEVPIIMKAVFDYIDTFSTRLREMELQRKLGIACKKDDQFRSLENFLSRFRWRRRLLIISTPDKEEWAYQQQMHSLTNQACNLGLRHMSVLKLVGRTIEDMEGVLELCPINGSTKVEREGLSASQVRDIRNYFQVSGDYFSMLLVGKDGNVKSWYPSPLWSMSTIYELIDSMQLRRQEMAIQLSLGMHCPEVDHGHHEEYHQSNVY